MGAFDFSNLVTGGASLIGGILNASSADRANRQQMEMYNKSLDFQKYQYEDSKRYNSAMAQVSRLRQAGLNPPMVFGEGSAGTVSSVSSPSPGSQHAVDYSGVMNAAANIGQGLYKASLDQSAINANNANAFKFKAEGLNTLIDNLNKPDRDRADIYRMLKQGKLSEEQANTELGLRGLRSDVLFSEMRKNAMQANLFEQTTQTEIERTSQAEAERKIMEFRLSKEPARFAAELQTLVSTTAQNYAQAYLAKVNARSIEALTPWQKQQLAAGIQDAVSRTTLNTKNKQLLEKQLGSFDTDKWFQRGAIIVNGITQGAMMALGLGSFRLAAGASKAAHGAEMLNAGKGFMLDKYGKLIKSGL